MRKAVNKSSVVWAWAFKGISPFNTGCNASSLISKAGFFETSPPAAASFSPYSLALNSISRSLAAVDMRVELPLSL